MKTKYLYKSLLFLCSLLFTITANANDDNKLYAGNIEVTKGSTEVILPVYLNNSVSMTGVQFDLYLPDGVEVAYTINRNNDKSYVTTITKGNDRFSADTDHGISCKLQSDGAMRIILSSVTNKSLVDYNSQGNDIRTSSPIIYIKLAMQDNLEKGEYAITMKRIVLSSYINNVTTKYDAEDYTSALTVKNPKYLVTFIADDVVLQSDSLEYGAQIIAPEIPEKEGYSTKGWNPEVDATVPSHDVTYTAIYDINKYLVTFIVDGEVVKSEKLDFGADIVAPAMQEKEGYTFSGWSPEVDATVPAHDVTYNATYDINSYLVTFIVDSDTIYSKKQEYGSEIAVPNVEEKEGYTFAGWDPEVDATVPAHNVTYTSVFDLNLYTITYMYNDSVVNTADVYFDEEIPNYEYKPEDDEYRTYIFLGWLLDGEDFTLTRMPAYDITLVANIECIDGIDNICARKEKGTITTTSGMIIKRHATPDDIKRLQKGVYIIDNKKVIAK